MTKITEDMRKELRKPLPSEAITQHPTKTYLSSIKAIYVTERMSDVFGVGGWKYKVEKIGEVGEVGEKGMVVVKVTYEIPEYGVYYESFGGNDNGGTINKNFDLGDAYKGATTDALTKIGSYLEIGIDVFKGKASKGSTNSSNTPVASDTPMMTLTSDFNSKDAVKALGGARWNGEAKKWAVPDTKENRSAIIGIVGVTEAVTEDGVIIDLEKVAEQNDKDVKETVENDLPF